MPSPDTTGISAEIPVPARPLSRIGVNFVPAISDFRLAMRIAVSTDFNVPSLFSPPFLRLRYSRAILLSFLLSVPSYGI